MFTKATPVAKKLKILIYGASGTGKTIAALSFPRPAVVDAENGTDLYAGRAGIPEFSVLRIKTFEELQKAIAYIQADKGKTFDTLIIDSVSVFYDVQKEAAAKTAANNDLGYREWAKINNRMVYLYNALTNLPVHIVCIAREAVEYETKNGNLTKIGTKPDADKRLVYMFDFIIRMNDDHSGQVIKSRGAGNIKQMPTVNWQAFAKIADMFTGGQTVLAQDEDEAAQRDSVAFVDVQPSKKTANGSVTSNPNEPNWWLALKVYLKQEYGNDIERIERELDIARRVLKDGDVDINSTLEDVLRAMKEAIPF